MMGIFRYILQGAGWEVGRTAAREGLEALAEKTPDASQRIDAAPAPDPDLEKRRERQRRLADKKQRAEIERQLAELKKKAQR